jgi:hypothetical protein
MRPGAHEAAKRISQVVGVSDAPRSTRAVLREIIISANWYSGNDADDRTDAWLTRFISRLVAILDEATSLGSVVTFTFNSSGTDFIQGACFAEPSASVAEKEAMANRTKLVDIFAQLASLTPIEFEKLSGRILALLGVSEPHVTQASADQGVDFYGRLSLGELLKPTSLTPGGEKQLHVWLVGQSKHYPQTSVGTGAIRELVGSVELARVKIFSGPSDPLSKLEVRLCDPIVYLMFTTGTFTAGSKALLTRSGVIAFDGMQISQLLADFCVGIENGNFNNQLFRLRTH